MAELFMRQKDEYESLSIFFKEEYLERKRSFSPQTVKNIQTSVRRFFIWYKHEMLGLEKEDFIVYKYPSTHQSPGADPEYRAEEICSMERDEIKDRIYGQGEYGLIDAEKCIRYEEQHQNRSHIIGHFTEKLNREPVLDYAKVSEQDVKQVTRNHISRFIDYLRDEKEVKRGSEVQKGVKRGTARKYKNALRHFIKFYSHPDYCPIREDIDFEHGAIKDSLDDFKNKKSKNRNLEGKTLSPDQVQALLENRSDDMERAMLLVLVKTGMRREELTNIKVKDVHLEENWIYLRHRKGGKSASVIFDDECKRYLKRYLESKPYDSPEDYLFAHGSGNKFSPDTITGKYKTWASQAGLKENQYRGPHDLRHTFASHHRKPVRDSGEGVRIFRRVQMSHKDNKNTGERYDYDFNDSYMKPIEERFEDYKDSIPVYLPY
jgi:integrase